MTKLYRSRSQDLHPKSYLNNKESNYLKFPSHLFLHGADLVNLIKWDHLDHSAPALEFNFDPEKTMSFELCVNRVLLDRVKGQSLECLFAETFKTEINNVGRKKAKPTASHILLSDPAGYLSLWKAGCLRASIPLSAKPLILK